MSRARIKAWIPPFLCGIAWASGAAAAAPRPLAIPTHCVTSSYAQPMEVVRIFKPTHDNLVQVSVFTFPEAPRGDHVLIQYASAVLVPIELRRHGGPATHESGDDGNPLPPSLFGVEQPQTQHRHQNVPSQAFVTDVPRERGRGRAVVDGRAGAYLAHLLANEPFTFWSVNYLHGYHVAAIPLTMLLGPLFLALVAILAWRMRSLRSAFVLCTLAFVFAYQARFVAGVLPATARDAANYVQSDVYGNLGATVSAAAMLRSEMEKAHLRGEVTVCGPMTTPLKYFLFPMVVDSMDKNWQRATAAVLYKPWDAKDGEIYCQNWHRAGKVLHVFPDFTAVAVFTDPPVP